MLEVILVVLAILVHPFIARLACRLIPDQNIKAMIEHQEKLQQLLSGQAAPPDLFPPTEHGGVGYPG